MAHSFLGVGNGVRSVMGLYDAFRVLLFLTIFIYILLFRYVLLYPLLYLLQHAYLLYSFVLAVTAIPILKQFVYKLREGICSSLGRTNRLSISIRGYTNIKMVDLLQNKMARSFVRRVLRCILSSHYFHCFNLDFLTSLN